MFKDNNLFYNRKVISEEYLYTISVKKSRHGRMKKRLTNVNVFSRGIRRRSAFTDGVAAVRRMVLLDAALKISLTVLNQALTEID